jgi:integrase
VSNHEWDAPKRGVQKASSAALELAAVAARAAEYSRAARSDATNRAYSADWHHVAAWCAAAGLQAFPMEGETLALYLAAQAGVLTPGTLRRRLSAISHVHRAAGEPSPTGSAAAGAVLRGIERRHRTEPRRATPLVVDTLRAVLDALPATPRGVRDRALLLVGWGGALRRGELVGLDRRDIAEVAEGLVLTVRRSKTLRPGDVRLVGIPRHEQACYDPVSAWLAWSGVLGDRAVPAFRAVDPWGAVHTTRLADRSVARLVARVAAAAGLSGAYSGHSLRAGAATSAAELGAPLHAVMALTGHRSAEMALRYIRPTTLFAEHAAAIAAL